MYQRNLEGGEKEITGWERRVALAGNECAFKGVISSNVLEFLLRLTCGPNQLCERRYSETNICGTHDLKMSERVGWFEGRSFKLRPWFCLSH